MVRLSVKARGESSVSFFVDTANKLVFLKLMKHTDGYYLKTKKP